MKRLIILLALLSGGCIENNIPYPVIELEITGVEGEGFTCAPEDIDAEQRIATIHLAEQTDLQRVPITRLGLNNEEARTDVTFAGEFDMRTPLDVTLSLYQDYEWRIVAEQQIERYFKIEGQFGGEVIDAHNRIATAYVPLGTDLDDITITALKLGPAEITEMTPAIEDLTSFFESVRHVEVRYHGRTERWMLRVLETDVAVQLSRVDAWSRLIWAYGEGRSGTDLGFRYRAEGTEEWTEVAATSDGGSFSARFGRK